MPAQTFSIEQKAFSREGEHFYYISPEDTPFDVIYKVLHGPFMFSGEIHVLVDNNGNSLAVVDPAGDSMDNGATQEKVRRAIDAVRALHGLPPQVYPW